MASQRLGIGLALIGLALVPAWGRAGPVARAGPDDVAGLAARIDGLIGAGYQARRATPAPLADDGEFCRRVYLDLAGRIPRVSEVRDFLADKTAGKRRALVDRLLAGPHYVSHFSHVWRALLLPQGNNQQVQFLAPQVENWVRVRLRTDVPYDRMVRDLLTANVANRNVPGAAAGAAFDPGAAAFYQANELKAENLAAATSRLFLGVKLECAQCHDHPFARWSRKQFWEYAAFFGGIKPQSFRGGLFTPAQDNPAVHEIKVAGTEKVVKARFLGGAVPKWEDRAGARTTLAAWVTAADNPFFARAGANRLWAHLFGTGLVDPADDFREDNPPSHPELLDELARQFAAHAFDPKFLIRAITASQTYQRTSAASHRSQEDPRLFARMALKGLTPEQLFDSIALATGYREGQVNRGRRIGFNPFGSPRAEFLARFANPSERRTEHQTSILQALALMNGKFVADATSLDRSETLAAVLDSPFMDERQRLDTLFLAALSRPMRQDEASRLVSYVEKGGPSGDTRKALADVFWVLLNSSEFILNH